MKAFAEAIGRMHKKFRLRTDMFPTNPIRTYIVTSRSAASAGERAVKTLRAWGLEIDELHFLAGAPKGPILDAIKPHIFFDDQRSHVLSALEMGTPAAHVAHGISQKYDNTKKTKAKTLLEKRFSFKT